MSKTKIRITEKSNICTALYPYSHNMFYKDSKMFNKHMQHWSAGVEITTRQLAKCEWNLELASNFLSLLASLASVFFPPLSESFSPAN
jgi:hypothetical protein